MVKLSNIEEFKNKYDKYIKQEKELKWLWFMILKIPHKYKIFIYETIGLNKLYEISNFPTFELLDFTAKVTEILKKYWKQICNKEIKEIAKKEFCNIISNGYKIIHLESNFYPKELMNIYDYPVCFLANGNLRLLLKRKVGIVGARDCSIYGARITKIISERLVKKGYVIVSGLAKGIDSIAHFGSGYNTIAVLGCGFSEKVFYPKENLKLYKNIVKNGGLVISEYLPRVNPTRYTFPERNRIIAGISESIIVTEAKKKSGSLITAEFALENGKDVYSVPGNILTPYFEGNNALIRDGGIPINSLEDVDLYFLKAE